MNSKSLLVEGTVDINALGNALNSSFGKSSTGKTHVYSVKGTVQGKYLVLSFGMVVNFVTPRPTPEATRDYERESKKITAEVLRGIKSEYKDIASKALSCKEVDSQTSVEFISMSNVKRTGYFKRVTRYELT